jgi:ABC-type antimicrobial peptide transport system permease subunit
VLLGAAVAFCARHLGGVLVLALLGLLLHTALAALFVLARGALAASLLAALLAGALPAWRACRVAPAANLRSA